MSEETVKAMEVVAEQGKQHMKLLQQWNEGYQLEARYDYERWVDKTEQLLKEWVSLEEAKRFRSILTRPYNHFRHAGSELLLFYDSIQAFLQSLLRGIMSYKVDINGMDLIKKRFQVLNTLYDLTIAQQKKKIFYDDFYNQIDLDRRDVDLALDYWEQKYLLKTDENDIWLLALGIDEVLGARQHPEKPTKFNPAYVINYITNTTNIGGDNYAGIQQNTHHSNQTTSVSTHQPISEILPKLAELIAAVRQADFEDRDEVVRDLEKAQQLAQSEDPKSKWALIQSKLTSAKTAMEVVGFSYKTLPYWPLIWQYFFG